MRYINQTGSSSFPPLPPGATAPPPILYGKTGPINGGGLIPGPTKTGGVLPPPPTPNTTTSGPTLSPILAMAQSYPNHTHEVRIRPTPLRGRTSGPLNFDGSNRRGYATDGTSSNLWFNQNGDSGTGTELFTDMLDPNASQLPAPDMGPLPRIPDIGPQLLAGDRVSRMDGVLGTATGMSLKTLPPQYQINWDDGTTSNEYSSNIGVMSRDENFTPGPTPPGDNTIDNCPAGEQATGEPICNETQYTVPGVDKCIDKTLALVLGAVAAYLIFKKDK